MRALTPKPKNPTSRHPNPTPRSGNFTKRLNQTIDFPIESTSFNLISPFSLLFLWLFNATSPKKALINTIARTYYDAPKRYKKPKTKNNGRTKIARGKQGIDLINTLHGRRIYEPKRNKKPKKIPETSSLPDLGGLRMLHIEHRFASLFDGKSPNKKERPPVAVVGTQSPLKNCESIQKRRREAPKNGGHHHVLDDGIRMKIEEGKEPGDFSINSGRGICNPPGPRPRCQQHQSKPQKPRLWIHFGTVYLVTAIVCYLLYYEYNYISNKWTQYFLSSKPQPHRFTVLVHAIHVPPRGSVSESVDNFFTEFHPSTYLSHTVIHHTNKLWSLINDANRTYTRLARLKSETGQQNVSRDGFLGLFGHKVDLVDQYKKKLEDIEQTLEAHR